jgi:hypothetical protein
VVLSEISAVTALGPENSKNVSNCGSGNSLTLAAVEAHFMPTAPNRLIFLISLV